MRTSKRPSETDAPTRLMCARCFKALGPFEQKTYTGFQEAIEGACAWCNRWLRNAELGNAHYVYESDTLPYTFQENMERAYRSFKALERVLPGLKELAVRPVDGGLHGSVCSVDASGSEAEAHLKPS